MESSDATKWRSLKKELSKVLKQPRPDREQLLMLETEIAKIESRAGWKTENNLTKK